VVKIGADACLCVPMRADAVDAVISHTDYRGTETFRQWGNTEGSKKGWVWVQGFFFSQL